MTKNAYFLEKKTLNAAASGALSRTFLLRPQIPALRLSPTEIILAIVFRPLNELYY